MNQIVYARMTEEDFKEIPSEIRASFLDWQREPDDYNELKKDETFCDLYSKYRKARKDLNEHKYNLRQKT